MSDPNPYRPPVADSISAATEAINRDSTPRNFYVAWPLVFAANLVVPMMFSSSLTRESGRIGIALAIMIFLFGGWCLGYCLPKTGRQLLAGGPLVAVSQLFPVHHFIAGIIGFEAARLAGGAIRPTDDVPLGRITTEYGGFICTCVTGAALVTFAVAIGWIVVALRQKMSKNPS